MPVKTSNINIACTIGMIQCNDASKYLLKRKKNVKMPVNLLHGANY